MRLKALAEIYKIHSFAPLKSHFSKNVLEFCQNFANFFRNFAKLYYLLNFTKFTLNLAKKIQQKYQDFKISVSHTTRKPRPNEIEGIDYYFISQEEFEKKADPARALVHKLCRQPDAQIRDNILRTYLAPQTELIAPDATRIPLETPMPAQISHAQFSDAVASTVEQLRGLDADGDLVNANIECCRQVAIEARRVLLETGAPEHVRAFEEELAKTWPMGSPNGG